MRPIWIMEILVIIFFAAGAGAVPVEEWNRTYSDAFFNDVQDISDGGYVLAGYKISNSGLQGAYLIKVDSNGNEEWNKLFAPETYVYIVEKTIDDGYILGGYKSFNGDYGSKEVALVIKTDASGNEQWNRTFDENIDKYDPLSGTINSIKQIKDGGYILTQNTWRNNTNYARIIKLDSAGNTEWIRTFENSSIASVVHTFNGSYIFAISIFHGGYNQEKYPEISLIKLDDRGNDLWNRTYQGTYQGIENVHIEQTAEDGLMIMGEIRTSRTGIDALLIKTDANGIEIWNKTFGGTSDDGFNSIQKTRDSGYIIAGYTGADRSADVLNLYHGDAWLVRVDADGNKKWDMVFGKLEMKQIRSVRQTGDGGYIFTGRSGINPQGSWVVKLTNNSMMPYNPPAIRDEGELSQIWIKTYNGGDVIYKVQQTRDGGFILTGSNFNNYDAFLMKTDSSGKELWNNTFNGSDERFYASEFRAVDETTDGGYILGGIAVYDAYGRYGDAWLVKTDTAGKEQWNRTIGSENAGEQISAVRAVDDGYVVAVNIIWNNYQEVPEETWLIRTDKKGNQLWMKKFNGTNRDLQRARDSGYILVVSESGGWGYKENTTPPTGWIIRTDESGNEMWKKGFGEYPMKMVTPNSVLQAKDNGYIVVGDYIQDAWVINYDQYGNEKWRKIIKSRAGGIDQSFYSIVETTDGNYIIGGRTNMYRTTGMDAILIKVDSNGNELWNMTAGGDGNQVVNSMQQTSDGWFIFGGSMGNPNSEGNLGALLMKVGTREENDAKVDDVGRSIDNVKQIKGINNTVTNHANESKPLKENTDHKLTPSFESYFAVLSVVLLSIFKRKVKSRILR